jgi:hypothetical protein
MSFTDADLSSAQDKIAAADFSEAEIDAIAHLLRTRDDTAGFAADDTAGVAADEKPARSQAFFSALGDRLVIPLDRLSGTDLGSGR